MKKVFHTLSFIAIFFLLPTIILAQKPPRELRDFSLTDLQESIAIDWGLSHGHEVLYFEVERAGKDKLFSSIATLSPQNPNLPSQSYEFVDNDPLSGLGFYRIKQTNKNGEVKIYESMDMHHTRRKGGASIHNFQVGAQNMFVEIQNSGQNTLFLDIVTLSGQVIASKKIERGIHDYSHSFSLKSISAGVYLIRLRQTSEELENRKFWYKGE